ncbi:flavodoxin reductase [Arcicella rosea]|uniref:Ferredoxin-NADP reductase n=1 Tax=Arcicella rosea TaxID=502909 RepID=A0A841EVR8_9BACT|nr:flavodoxin reductase [Arcicella rosea]MBB6004400.1 ferredoxin-NADP reductase [Arcicella rosea]
MEQHIVKIQTLETATHDVLKIRTSKPFFYPFLAGQATEVSINKNGWREKRNPFTFTSLPEDKYLEFFIKIYPTHNGVTNQLLDIQKGDELILHEVFGDIAYQKEGVFIAGGAGVTPFIAIFRDLVAKNQLAGNKLFFANKTKADIILHEEFEEMLGKNFINILSDEDEEGYAHGFITEEFIVAHCDVTNKIFYVCGPPSMMEIITIQLKNLGVKNENIVKESF